MLLSDGQSGTVNPLVNLLPLLCLKGIESFPSITHPKDTGSKEGKVSGIPLCVSLLHVLHARSKMPAVVVPRSPGRGWPWSGDLATVHMG